MARQCEHCGNEIREGLKFCPKCGKAQGASKPKPTIKSQQPPIPKNESNKSIMLVGVIVVALIIGAGLGYYIFTNQKKRCHQYLPYRLRQMPLVGLMRKVR